jgi:hypothetical protein
MFNDLEIQDQTFQSNDLRRSDFSHSTLTNCVFTDVNFTQTEFLGASFLDCEFTGCNFHRAFLTGAQFARCEFNECNFDDAYIFSTQFKLCEIYGGSMSNTLLSRVEFPETRIDSLNWHGTPINRPPVIVEGIEYPIVALDNGHMHVGCQYDTYENFWNSEGRKWAKEDGLRALRYWKKHKQWVFDMLKARGLYDFSSNA